MTTKVDTAGDSAERIGAYRVIRRLATGGMSDVLLAKAQGPHGFERTVVLKVLLSHFGKDDDVAKMFAREAAAYARLSHPHIVRLFDFFAVPAADGKKSGGQLVMVLEYVDGAPLARLKSMAKAIGKELDDKASIYIATCIFDALAAAHSAVDDAQIPAPVIHRDVNPSNVLVPWDAYPKLADFGVAKVTGLGHHSVVGMIKGTYGYMAPEQVTGQEAVTPRADVYAAGIILWELLTRRRAFQRGALPEVEALRQMAEPRLPALESIRSDVDRSIREALRRALEPRAEKRKITAEEMVSILNAVVPADQGRERLTSLLGLVRNDARAASAQGSIAPPPMAPPSPGSSSKELLPNVVIPGAPKMAPDFGPLTISGVAPPPTQQGIAPPGGSRTVARAGPPRPMPSSAKMPAAAPLTLPKAPSSADLPPAPSSAKLPAARSSAKLPAATPIAPPVSITKTPSSAKIPTTTLASASVPAVSVPAVPAGTDASVREMLSLPTRPVMPAVSAPAPVAPPPPPQRPGSKPVLPATAGAPGALPPPEGPPKAKTASARLGESVPPEPMEPVPATRPLNALLDQLGESVVPQSPGPMRDPAMSLPPDSPRVSAPLKDLTGGLGLRDAIDEIMKGVPGSQQRIAAAAPAPAPEPAPEMPRDSEKPQTRETTRVPASMTSTLIGLIPPAPPPMSPSGFPADPDKAPATVASASDLATTPPAPGVEDFPNATDDPAEEPRETTVVMDPPPATSRMQSTPNALAQTLAMDSRPTPAVPTPRFTPAPMQAVPIPDPLPSPEPAPAAAKRAGAERRPADEAYRVPKKDVSVAGPAIMLVVLIAVGIAGTIAYVRYQAQRENAATQPSAALPPATPSGVPSALASESATPASSAPPPSLDASVATATATDASAAATSADAGAPIAAGMGLLKTPNAAPGRRIFVDEKVAGQTPQTITLACGAHKVRLGSTGATQDIDVPCSGEVVVGDVFLAPKPDASKLEAPKPAPSPAPEAPDAPAP